MKKQTTIVTGKQLAGLLENINKIKDPEKRASLLDKFNNLAREAEYIGTAPGNSGLN